MIPENYDLGMKKVVLPDVS